MPERDLLLHLFHPVNLRAVSFARPLVDPRIGACFFRRARVQEVCFAEHPHRRSYIPQRLFCNRSGSLLCPLCAAQLGDQLVLPNDLPRHCVAVAAALGHAIHVRAGNRVQFRFLEVLPQPRHLVDQIARPAKMPFVPLSQCLRYLATLLSFSPWRKSSHSSLCRVSIFVYSAAHAGHRSTDLSLIHWHTQPSAGEYLSILVKPPSLVSVPTYFSNSSRLHLSHWSIRPTLFTAQPSSQAPEARLSSSSLCLSRYTTPTAYAAHISFAKP